MKQKTSQVLFDYWNDVRDGRAAPRRFEIEPNRIGSILPETFILERIDSLTFRFRLAGTRICEQFGREFRGSNFLDMWGDSDRITLERQFMTMCKDNAVGISTFIATSSQSKQVQFEIIVLPLFHTRPVVTRFLGAVSAIEPPHWLGADPLRSQSLISYETIWPDGQRPVQPKDLFRHNLEAADPSNGRIVRHNRRQFRVYEGGLTKQPLERS